MRTRILKRDKLGKKKTLKNKIQKLKTQWMYLVADWTEQKKKM